MREILILAPHPDDAEYGCWVTAMVAREQGCRVHIAVLAHSGDDRRKEAEEAAKCIGADMCEVPTLPDGKLSATTEIVTFLDEIIHKSEDRVLVLAPHFDDSHPDHRAASEIGNAITRRSAADLAYYATPTTGASFTPTVFTPITLRHSQERRKALAHHATQADKKYFEENAVDVKDGWWGMKAGVQRAEPIQPVHFAGGLNLF